VIRKKLISVVFCLSIIYSYPLYAKDYSLQEIYKNKSNSVVGIISHYESEKDQIHTGTGFFISSNLIVTAAHVVHNNPFNLNEKLIIVLNKDPVTLCDGTPVKIDLEHDIALIQFSTTKEVKCLNIDINDDLIAGDKLITIGNPSCYFRIISEGLVAATEPQFAITTVDKDYYKDMIISTLIVYPGNSGGPVFNTRGEVVGILTLGNEKERLAFVQKAKYIKRLMESKSSDIIVYKKEPNDEDSLLRKTS